MGANAESISAEMFDKQIKDYSIDSRSVGAGELFFALSQQELRPAPVLMVSLSMLIALSLTRLDVVRLRGRAYRSCEG
jgi:hypothetical protein